MAIIEISLSDDMKIKYILGPLIACSKFVIEYHLNASFHKIIKSLNLDYLCYYKS